MACAPTIPETAVIALAGAPEEWRPLLDDELARLAGRPVRLVLDVSAADPADATALGWFVLAQKRLQRDGGELALVSSRSEPLELLRVTGLDRLLDVTVR
jgi:anti-anti-sigma factor